MLVKPWLSKEVAINYQEKVIEKRGHQGYQVATIKKWPLIIKERPLKKKVIGFIKLWSSKSGHWSWRKNYWKARSYKKATINYQEKIIENWGHWKLWVTAIKKRLLIVNKKLLRREVIEIIKLWQLKSSYREVTIEKRLSIIKKRLLKSEPFEVIGQQPSKSGQQKAAIKKRSSRNSHQRSGHQEAAIKRRLLRSSYQEMAINHQKKSIGKRSYWDHQAAVIKK